MVIIAIFPLLSPHLLPLLAVNLSTIVPCFFLLDYFLTQLAANIARITFYLFSTYRFSPLFLVHPSMIASSAILRHYHILVLIKTTTNTFHPSLAYHFSLLGTNLAIAVSFHFLWQFFFFWVTVNITRIFLRFFPSHYLFFQLTTWKIVFTFCLLLFQQLLYY